MKLKYLIMALMISPMVNSTVFAEGINSSFLQKEIDPIATKDYWTPARLRDAKPFEARISSNVVTKKSSDQIQSMNKVTIGEDGRPPIDNISPNLKPLFTPINVTKDTISFDRGTLNEQFSSSRLVPLTADLIYPYRTVGKLYFTAPDGNFVCSASVLRPRVVVTAGHCVHAGSGGAGGFYTNFLFIPAFRDGASPFGSWSTTFVNVTNTWATGGGSFPNAADYAMLEMQDQILNGAWKKVGNITGFLGYQLQSLIPNHVHQLGYPCNFDSCAKMHQVAAQSAVAVAPNNVEYGSDMGGGSSGGPWLQNLGTASIGQTRGMNVGRNRIVGVTSWGYNNPSQMALGASNIDNRFVALLNAMCVHKTGNCS